MERCADVAGIGIWCAGPQTATAAARVREL